MSLFMRARSGLRVRDALPGEARRVLQFLDRRPAENAFLSHLVRRDGLRSSPGSRSWYLAERGGEIRGSCVVSANVVPAAADVEAARSLAVAVGALRSGTQSLVGERHAVDAMWEVLRARSPAPRLVRDEQPFYVLERGAPAGDRESMPAPDREPAIRLRLARGADLDVLIQASADMLREEILDDPYARDPVGFRAQVWRMIQEDAIFVGEVDGRVVFKAHANVRTPLAAQVSGVYTLPADRRRGHARAALRALARILLADHPVLCLYVNGENRAAIRAYESAGFRRAGTFKSVFFEAGT